MVDDKAQRARREVELFYDNAPAPRRRFEEMKSTFAWSLALSAFALLAACGGEGSGAAPATTAQAVPTTTATATAATTATATTTATAAPTDTPAATGTASAAPTGTASAAATGSAAPTGTATAAAKKFACGDKGQPNCPMQGWMKSAMGSAVASGDGERIAKALETVARKPVAGFGNWTAIALEGAAKARAGDIDGAKLSCKKCHDAYKHKYTTTMRDQPW
jgi:hypothetical protein